MSTSVGEDMPRLMAHVRDVLIPQHEALPGGAGMIGAALMRAELDIAARALASGDVVAIVRSYAELKGFEESA